MAMLSGSGRISDYCFKQLWVVAAITPWNFSGID